MLLGLTISHFSLVHNSYLWMALSYTLEDINRLASVVFEIKSQDVTII